MKERNLSKITRVKTYGDCVKIGLEVPASFRAEPGQFVHVRCDAPGLVLRRPYSIYDLNEGIAALLVRKAGAGSRWLCGLLAGDMLDFLGPLGRAFTLDGGGRHALVAGGTGIAPMRYLAACLRSRGVEPILFWGIEGVEAFGSLPHELGKEYDLRLATVDGSAGRRGDVLELLEEAGGVHFDNIYACGPRGMLAGLAERVGRERISILQVSMEERMACGVGACRGCVVPVSGTNGGYLTACKDGPVFGGEELDWERI